MRPLRHLAALALALTLLLLAACDREIVELRRDLDPDATDHDDAGTDSVTSGCVCLLPCDSPDVCRGEACTADNVCDDQAPPSCSAATPCAEEGAECRSLDAPRSLCSE
jgi:hypothetical protein